MQLDHSFPPVWRPDARVLILGSLPGKRSLAEQRYYAHPRNAFWAIIAEYTGVGVDQSYEDRIDGLLETGIALWDVVGSAHRPGSLDSAIDKSTVQINPLNQLVSQSEQLQAICFNGGKAASLFRAAERQWAQHIPLPKLLLPSTSPAHAALSLDEKRKRWRKQLNPYLANPYQGE